MRSSPRQRARGLSMVELLVAISIGLFLVGGAGFILINSKRSYTETDRLSRVGETARFAMMILGKDIRQAGYFGAAGVANLSTDPDLNTVADDCNSPGDAYGFANYFRVVRASAAGAALGCIADAVPDSDIIVVKTVEATPLTDGARDDRSDDTGTIDTPRALDAQRVYVLANNDRGILFRGNDASPPALGVGGDVPFGEAWPYVVNIYYVRAGNTPTLSRLSLRWNGTRQAMLREDLAEGVEQMRVQLGEDTSLDGDVDTMVDSTTVTDWGRVLSAQPSMLVRSLQPEPGYQDDRTYQLANATFTPGGSFRRTVISQTVSIRNTAFALRLEP